jgi:hypothetical protein
MTGEQLKNYCKRSDNSDRSDTSIFVVINNEQLKIAIHNVILLLLLSFKNSRSSCFVDEFREIEDMGFRGVDSFYVLLLRRTYEKYNFLDL